jgi:hypothetical protein
LEFGYTSERLMAEWPAVSPSVAAVVRNFCASQAGFGPLAWDAPGYEEPQYVIRILRTAFAGSDPDEMRPWRAHQPSLSARASGAPQTTALRRVLAFWLDFLERETWYVRRAFYVGMLPLLRRLTAGYQRRFCGFRLEDLLFLEIQELTAGSGDPEIINARRRCYLADTAYLTHHGIEPGRLTAILEAS